MKKSTIFGLVFGIAAASAVAVAVSKISGEMKNGLVEEEFDSPFGDNWIKISMGSSETAKEEKSTYCVFFTDSDGGNLLDFSVARRTAFCGKYRTACSDC